MIDNPLDLCYNNSIRKGVVFFMKKIYRVLCKVDNGCTIEKYNTYVFAYLDLEAEEIACRYWEDTSPEVCAHAIEVECIYNEKIEVIGIERVY